MSMKQEKNLKNGGGGFFVLHEQYTGFHHKVLYIVEIKYPAFELLADHCIGIFRNVNFLKYL